MSSDPSAVPKSTVSPESRVTLRFERFASFVEEYSSNISLGGVFIKTHKARPVATEIHFEFKLVDGFRLLHGQGEVVWVRLSDNGPDRPAGMGVRFSAIDESGRQLVLKLLEEQVKSGGAPFEVENIPGDADGSPVAPKLQLELPDLSEDPTLVGQRARTETAPGGTDTDGEYEAGFDAPWGERLPGIPTDLLDEESDPEVEKAVSSIRPDPRLDPKGAAAVEAAELAAVAAAGVVAETTAAPEPAPPVAAEEKAPEPEIHEAPGSEPASAAVEIEGEEPTLVGASVAFDDQEPTVITRPPEDPNAGQADLAFEPPPEDELSFEATFEPAQEIEPEITIEPAPAAEPTSTVLADEAAAPVFEIEDEPESEPEPLLDATDFSVVEKDSADQGADLEGEPAAPQAADSWITSAAPPAPVDSATAQEQVFDLGPSDSLSSPDDVTEEIEAVPLEEPKLGLAAGFETGQLPDAPALEHSPQGPPPPVAPLAGQRPPAEESPPTGPPEADPATSQASFEIREESGGFQVQPLPAEAESSFFGESEAPSENSFAFPPSPPPEVEQYAGFGGFDSPPPEDQAVPQSQPPDDPQSAGFADSFAAEESSPAPEVPATSLFGNSREAELGADPDVAAPPSFDNEEDPAPSASEMDVQATEDAWPQAPEEEDDEWLLSGPKPRRRWLHPVALVLVAALVVGAYFLRHQLSALVGLGGEPTRDVSLPAQAADREPATSSEETLAEGALETPERPEDGIAEQGPGEVSGQQPVDGQGLPPAPASDQPDRTPASSETRDPAPAAPPPPRQDSPPKAPPDRPAATSGRADQGSRPTTGGAGQVLDISFQSQSTGTRISIRLDGELAAHRLRHDSLSWAPDREMLTIQGVENFRRTEITVGTQELERIRIGFHEGQELRLVFDLASERVAIVDVSNQGSRIDLLLQ